MLKANQSRSIIETPIPMPNMQASKIASATWPENKAAPPTRIAVKMAMLIKNMMKPKVTLVIILNPFAK
jgi:hypothetical protein